MLINTQKLEFNTNKCDINTLFKNVKSIIRDKNNNVCYYTFYYNIPTQYYNG